MESENELAKEEQERLEKLEVFFLLLFLFYIYLFFPWYSRLLTLLLWEGRIGYYLSQSERAKDCDCVLKSAISLNEV